jgi:hypothetical protein
MIRAAEHLFFHLLAIIYIFFGDIPFQIHYLFLNWAFGFYNCWILVFYIFWILIFYHIGNLQTFSHILWVSFLLC